MASGSAVGKGSWRAIAPLPRYLRSWSAIWGDWFAWARTAIVACCRIWVRVISATAAATSASRMRLFAAPVFSDATPRLLIVDWRRFW